MAIFDDMKRTDVEPASHLIGSFEYLNASAREEAERVRALLEEMIGNYPEDHREALKLDHDAVTAAIEGGQQAPLYQEDLDGLSIVIEPVPKNIRGTGGRAIGIQMLPGGAVQPHLAIASSLASKVGRYGELDLPYIIALTAMETFANEDSAVHALLGRRL